MLLLFINLFVCPWKQINTFSICLVRVLELIISIIICSHMLGNPEPFKWSDSIWQWWNTCQSVKRSKFHFIKSTFKCFKYVCTIEAYVSMLKQAEHFSHTSLQGYTHFISLRKTFDWKLKIPGFCLIHELNKQSTVQKSIALKLWPRFDSEWAKLQ